jgi:glycosyltransferase involved in cell wall biosynthesis
LKIVVNTRLLIKDKLEGIGWFSFETLKRITQKHKDCEFIFLFDRPFDEQFVFGSNVTPIVIQPPARHPILFVVWFEFSVYRVLKKYKPDLFLSPDGYLSLRTSTKSLAVIHDINFEHYPSDLRWDVRKYYHYFFPRFAKKAVRIATVSEFSKNDISLKYGVDKNKIDVVFNGASDIFEPTDLATQIEFKNRFTKGKDFFIFVGSMHPRKNITRLLLAFDSFKSKNKTEIKLLLVGEKYWWNNEMETAYKNMKYKNDVEFVGRFNQKKLKEGYGSAIALVFVPYFEGFGIPIMEAFKCGTPVITSNITAMPEIAGDAAFIIDPFSIDSIANALTKMALEEETRRYYTSKGFARESIFSWDKTADLLWMSIEKTIAN